jgi:four helix bundle protein
VFRVSGKKDYTNIFNNLNIYFMATIKNFEDLEIWQKARELSKYIFTLTQRDPFCKDYSLKDQIKRSSGSIMDNIAEGFERDGNKEFVNFLTFSKGSTGEVRSQAYRVYDYGYISNEELDFLIKESKSLSERIGKFISYLKNSEFKGTKFKRNNDQSKNE